MSLCELRWHSQGLGNFTIYSCSETTGIAVRIKFEWPTLAIRSCALVLSIVDL